MTILMKKTDYQKLTLLKHAFYTSPFCTIDSLSAYLKVSTRTIERYFKELQVDCRSLFSEEDFSLKRLDGKVILELTSHLSPHYILDRLHVEYTERSLEFKLIHSLLLKKYTHINELADELFLSTSSLYRLLNKVEPMIHAFNLRFSFFDRTSSLNFDCEEKDLRAFIYYFYWFSLKGIHLEPLDAHKEIIKNSEATINWQHYEDWLPSKKEQIRYVSVITSIRQKQARQQLKMTDEVQKIAQVFLAINDLSNICTPLLSLNPNDVERLFFNIFLRFTLSGADSFEQKQQITLNLKKLDLPIIQDCEHLLSTVNEHFKLSLSNEQYVTFFFDYLLTLLFIFYFNIQLPEEFKEIDHLNIFNQHTITNQMTLLEQVQEFYPNLQFNLPIPTSHQQTIIGVICLLIDSQKKATIQVAIQYSKSIVGESTIQRKLRNVFSSDSLLFTTNYDQATLIISDCFTPASDNNHHFFYLDSLTDPLRWELLITFVKEVLVKHGVY